MEEGSCSAILLLNENQKKSKRSTRVSSVRSPSDGHLTRSKSSSSNTVFITTRRRTSGGLKKESGPISTYSDSNLSSRRKSLRSQDGLSPVVTSSMKEANANYVVMSDDNGVIADDDYFVLDPPPKRMSPTRKPLRPRSINSMISYRSNHKSDVRKSKIGDANKRETDGDIESLATNEIQIFEDIPTTSLIVARKTKSQSRVKKLRSFLVPPRVSSSTIRTSRGARTSIGTYSTASSDCLLQSLNDGTDCNSSVAISRDYNSHRKTNTSKAKSVSSKTGTERDKRAQKTLETKRLRRSQRLSFNSGLSKAKSEDDSLTQIVKEIEPYAQRRKRQHPKLALCTDLVVELNEDDEVDDISPLTVGTFDFAPIKSTQQNQGTLETWSSGTCTSFEENDEITSEPELLKRQNSETENRNASSNEAATSNAVVQAEKVYLPIECASGSKISNRTSTGSYVQFDPFDNRSDRSEILTSPATNSCRLGGPPGLFQYCFVRGDEEELVFETDTSSSSAQSHQGSLNGVEYHKGHIAQMQMNNFSPSHSKSLSDDDYDDFHSARSRNDEVSKNSDRVDEECPILKSVIDIFRSPDDFDWRKDMDLSPNTSNDVSQGNGACFKVRYVKGGNAPMNRTVDCISQQSTGNRFIDNTQQVAHDSNSSSKSTFSEDRNALNERNQNISDSGVEQSEKKYQSNKERQALRIEREIECTERYKKIKIDVTAHDDNKEVDELSHTTQTSTMLNDCADEDEIKDYQPPAKFRGKTILWTLPEAREISSARLAQRKVDLADYEKLLIEKKQLEERLNAHVYASFEDRYKQFECVFEELRDLRNDNKELHTRLKDTEQIYESIQKQMTDIVPAAMDKIQQLTEKVSVLQEENERLQCLVRDQAQENNDLKLQRWGET